MDALEYLNLREAELIRVLEQLDEQMVWARANNQPDLARAYAEGQRHMLDELESLQRTRERITE